ncbi:MAG: hypothetical protein GX546_02715 [Acholeplasmataceae bacterium]|jgi:hypothetical protein|nr:hypothetical protein [Acholeplasmataceae bacterium]
MEMTKKELRKSFEYLIYRKELIFWGLFCLGTFLLLLTIGISIQVLEILISSIPIFVLFFVFVILNGRLMIKIIDDCKDWNYGEAILTNPKPTFNRTVYFIAEITADDDKIHKISTNPFAISTVIGFLRPSFSDFNNKKALVKYNLKTREVFVLELL